MKQLYIFLSLLCVTPNLRSMNNNEHTPLLNSAKHDDLVEITLGSIHNQLPHHQIPQQTSTEPSFINQIILENKKTMCSPTLDDVCHPKNFATKTAITLGLASVLYGSLNGVTALTLLCCNGTASSLCVPHWQIYYGATSCCSCWCRNCIFKTMLLDCIHLDWNSHQDDVGKLRIPL